MDVSDQMRQLARQAKQAARHVARLATSEKNEALLAMADALEQNQAAIRSANEQDLAEAAAAGLSAPMLERLKLDEKRILAMAKGLREVAALPDPVGRLLEARTRPNGLKLQKVTTPIGVIVIIYESRPNVTVDAAGLCFKSGNATILRGGKEALRSNRCLAEILVSSAAKRLKDFPTHAIQVVPTTDRQAIPELLALTEYVDLCMPRGGESLIRAVTECSKVPVIKHYKGVCHVYVDREADLRMASEIVLNAKLQRPAVCNAMETLLLDRPIAGQFLGQLGPRLSEANVEVHADETAFDLLQSLPSGAKPLRIIRARETDWSTEYNDYILNIRVLEGVREAIQHISQYGSNHSDSIVTRSEERAREFLNEVDSAAVYWNASTRFTDGGEFGMGAEIGISTDKVGARGPMGLEELTSYKWIGIGNGQVRV